MGQIRKRGTFYQIRFYRHGQLIEETTEHTKWEDARTLLRDRENAIEKGVPITARSTKVTFDDAVKGVISDYTVNGKKSLEDVQRRIDLHLTPYFGSKRLSAISVADVRAFAAKRLEAGASHGEVNRELAIVKRAFRLAVEAEKYHGRVPKIPMLQERNVRQGFFDDVMVEAVLAKLPAPLQPAIRFAYCNRLACPVGSAADGMAAGGPDGRRRTPGPGHHEESGEPSVPLHRRSEDPL